MFSTFFKLICKYNFISPNNDTTDITAALYKSLVSCAICIEYKDFKLFINFFLTESNHISLCALK